MSKRKEKISAFLDNDLHRDELMSFSLLAESDDAKVAQRYQMLGDALRGEMGDASFIDVSHAVREALADENIVDQMTVEPKAESTARPAVTPVSQAAAKPGLFDLSAWFKPVAGMAVAASVAVVMVFTLSEQDSGVHAPLANNVETQPAVQLAVDGAVVDDNAARQSEVANAKKDTDLDPYINQHLEFATQDALQGRLPYVRAVSFESEK